MLHIGIFKKRFFSVIITIMLSACIGFSVLMIVCALPTGRVALHVRESGRILMAEGDYPMVVPGDQLSVLDNFTDCIMLLTSAYTGDENCVKEAAYAYRIYKKGASKEESCSVCGVLPEEETQVLDYMTYWHGYKVILKPLLFFFHINQIRQINALVILGWIALISILMYQNHLKAYIFPYLLGISFLNIPVLARSLQFSSMFHLTSVFVILLLAGARVEKLREKCWMLFLFAGICTSYFDFLTYPIVVLGFLLVMDIGLIEVQGKQSGITVWEVVGKSALWGIGYVGMWAMKWVIATIVSGENIFALAFDKFLTRSGNMVGGNVFTVKEMFGAMNNYAMSNAIKVFVPLFLIFMLICSVKLGGWKERKNYVAAALLLLVASYPLIWYFLAKNHSYQHIFFTYRSMSVSVFAGTSMLNPLVKAPGLKNNRLSVGRI